MQKGGLSCLISQIVTDYTSGKSIEELARKYGCNSEAIRYRLIKNNISRRAPSTYRKNFVDRDFFNAIDSEEKAWILGFIASDGSVRKYNRGYYLSIEIQKDDEEILRTISKIMKSNYPLYRRPGANCVRFTISSKKIVNSLIENGIVQNKTNTISYPTKIPHYLNRHFIRGVFDGDGWLCYDKNKRFHMGFCGNKPLLSSILSFIQKEANVDPVKILQGSATKRENIVQMTFSSKKNIAKLIKYFYNNPSIYLPRKKKLVDLFCEKNAALVM